MRYFYCKEEHSWIEFDFSEGFYLLGHSLRTTKLEKETVEGFYASLVAPCIITDVQQGTKSEQTANQYEMQLIYYSKYNNDSHKFKEALLRHIAELKTKGK
jgi:hypothetical protein